MDSAPAYEGLTTREIADHLNNAHKEGHAWGDMAILCHDYATMDLYAHTLQQQRSAW